MNVSSLMDDSMEGRLSRMIERLWEVDCTGTGTGTETKRTVEKEMVERHFLRTHYMDQTGRFVMRIPFKPNVTDIGSSETSSTASIHVY